MKTHYNGQMDFSPIAWPLLPLFLRLVFPTQAVFFSGLACEKKQSTRAAFLRFCVSAFVRLCVLRFVISQIQASIRFKTTDVSCDKKHLSLEQYSAHCHPAPNIEPYQESCLWKVSDK